MLTNVAKLAALQFKKDITIESCIDSAYDVIAKRKGEMVNGTFIKDVLKEK